MKLHNITVMKQSCFVMKLAVCLQTAWEGTLALDTKQRGLRWQQRRRRRPRFCATASSALRCSRAHVRRSAHVRGLETSPSISPAPLLSDKICTHWCANTALISILLAHEPPVFSLSPEQLLSTHVYTLKPAAERHRNVHSWTTSSLCTVLTLVSQNIASFRNKTLLNNCNCHFKGLLSAWPSIVLYLDNEQ